MYVCMYGCIYIYIYTHTFVHLSVDRQADRRRAGGAPAEEEPRIAQRHINDKQNRKSNNSGKQTSTNVGKDVRVV